MTEDMHGLTSVQVKPQSFAKSTIMMFTSSYYPTFSAFFNVKVYWHFPNIYSIAINDPRMNDDWPQDFYEKYFVFHAQMIKSMKMCMKIHKAR